MNAETVRKILEELVTRELPHWRVYSVSLPLQQADRDVERVTVTFEIEEWIAA